MGSRSQKKQMICTYPSKVKSAAWFREAKSLGRDLIDANLVVSALDEREKKMRS